MIKHGHTNKHTLAEYGSDTYPTFSQLRTTAEPAPESVVDSITDEINRFQTAVTINEDPAAYLVGGIDKPRSGINTIRLYHHPTGANTGLAGELRWGREITQRGEPDAYTVGFSPVGEQTIERVDSLAVEHHDRSKRLENLLPEIRSELTGLDWTDGNDPRASVDDWHTAAKALSDFASSHDSPYSFPPQDINRNKPTYVLARWGSPAVDSLVHVEQALLKKEGRIEAVTPEAFRQLLFDYADANGIKAQ